MVYVWGNVFRGTWVDGIPHTCIRVAGLLSLRRSRTINEHKQYVCACALLVTLEYSVQMKFRASSFPVLVVSLPGVKRARPEVRISFFVPSFSLCRPAHLSPPPLVPRLETLGLHESKCQSRSDRTCSLHTNRIRSIHPNRIQNRACGPSSSTSSCRRSAGCATGRPFVLIVVRSIGSNNAQLYPRWLRVACILNMGCTGRISGESLVRVAW